jgi:small subunit ribosomal protein S24e
LHLLKNILPQLEHPPKAGNAGSTKSGSGGAGAKLLSDGTVVNYEKARQFMDYYCRRFGFGKEDITWEDTGSARRGHNNSWEAVMTVGGRRIGIGSGSNKKNALVNCYLDVTHYLESCDTDLWKTFMEAQKSGKDLGMAPKIYLPMSDRLDDDIRDLCHDIKQSTLYRNRPSRTASKDVQATSSARTRLPVSTQYLTDKSTRLAERLRQYKEDPAHDRMRTTRSSLPVFTRAEEVIKHVEDNEVTICMAATGSGKTTQIPQLILDDWIAKGKGAQCNIVCTQPRRLAAISVADRVAKERGETVGRGSVGYSVRFENKVPEEHGSITFCTIGIFLKRMQSALLEGSSAGGQNLDDVTHVIVDEVHERDVDTDLLLVVLKRLLADRKAKGKPIRVVLMSATIDPSLFRQYFPDQQGEPAKVIDIPGRSFPVEKHFLDSYISDLASVPAARGIFMDKDVSKYLQAELSHDALRAINIAPPPSDVAPRDDDSNVPAPLIALTVAHVLKRTDSGHVLVFLPGWDDIMQVNRALTESGSSLGHQFTDSSKFSIHFLHSSIPLAEQQVIFDPPKEGVRRIILATNIAETSVTIPDVVYVVDSGKVKEQRYDPDRHMSSLVSAWVGSSNLNQRAGRAGRHRPGEYFGVLTRRRADLLHPYQMVEMKRVDLSNVVMHVKALNFPGMAVEDVLAATIEPPAAQRVAAAMENLKMVGALDQEKNLTPLGRVLLQLPVEVNMGRMVLLGSFFRCLDHALTLAALLTNRDPFVSPMHLKAESSAKKNSWTPNDFRSDAIATLQAYNAWWALQSRGEYQRANQFCSENFLAKPTLLMIPKIKTHLLQSLRQAGVLDVSAGGGGGSYVPPGRRRDREEAVPAELNANADSMPLLAALIAVASQPNFAIRTGNTYRTQKDKVRSGCLFGITHADVHQLDCLHPPFECEPS